YRNRKPGSSFLIPVKLSSCDLPPIEIDGTRTLDRLQHIDLFPEEARARGMQRLLAALPTTTATPVILERVSPDPPVSRAPLAPHLFSRLGIEEKASYFVTGLYLGLLVLMACIWRTGANKHLQYLTNLYLLVAA